MVSIDINFLKYCLNSKKIKLHFQPTFEATSTKYLCALIISTKVPRRETGNT